MEEIAWFVQDEHLFPSLGGEDEGNTKLLCSLELVAFHRLQLGDLLGSQKLLQLLHEAIDSNGRLANASKAAKQTYSFKNLLSVIFPR